MRKAAGVLAALVLAILASGAKSELTVGGASSVQDSSLKGLSNSELIDYMGPGKREADDVRAKTEAEHRLVWDKFWNLPPKEAALAFLEPPPAKEGEPAYSITLEPGPDSPPQKGTLVFSDFSDRSYQDVRSHYFIRFDRESSYLLFARTLFPGQVGYDFTTARMAYDFRACDLDYKEALHFAQTVWWITKARSKKVQTAESHLSFSLSSADGRGRLTLTPEDGRRPVILSGVLRMFSEGGWARGDDTEARLNEAGVAVERVLLDHLGKRWTDRESRDILGLVPITRGAQDYTPGELARLTELAGRFLELWSRDEKRISPWHAAAAAQAAGNLALVQFLPALEALQKNLPAVSPASASKRPPSEADMKARIEKLSKEKDEERVREKVMALLEEYAEQLEAYQGSALSPADELRDAAALSLRKLKSVDDIPALTRWAKAREQGSGWAASRIRAISPCGYADILESWMAKAPAEEKRQILMAINRACPERGVAISERVLAGGKDDLSTAASQILREANRTAAGKEGPEALIKIARDTKEDWEERVKAIELLVPAEDPTRFPGREVDDALLAILKNETSQMFDLNFALGRAAKALAWRKRVSEIEALWHLLDGQAGEQGPSIFGEAVSAVTYLSRCAGEKEKARLAQFAARHFARTNAPIPEILWSAWSADLRSLKPDIERLATASPDEAEGERATTLGGPAAAVKEKFHLARKIAALWSEKDLATRGKLLLAFGFGESFYFVESDELERREKMKEDLAELGRAATPAEMAELSEFLAWCESEVIEQERGTVYRERKVKFARLARESLGLGGPDGVPIP